MLLILALLIASVIFALLMSETLQRDRMGLKLPLLALFLASFLTAQHEASHLKTKQRCEIYKAQTGQYPIYCPPKD